MWEIPINPIDRGTKRGVQYLLPDLLSIKNIDFYDFYTGFLDGENMFPVKINKVVICTILINRSQYEVGSQ